MKPAWVVTWALGFLTVSASAQNEITKDPGSLGPSGTELPEPDCPWKRRSATLVPSFTKTTPHPTTTRHPTTTHHSTTKHHKKTTHHSTTTHHPTTTQHNMTTRHPTTTHHPTTSRHNMTTHFPTTRNPNTTTHHPPTTHHSLTTHHPTRHAVNHTTVPVNYTTHHFTSTAPAPTQSPFVPIGDYKVGNMSALCLRMQTGLQIQVRYLDKDKHQKWGTFAIQPNKTKHVGKCFNQTAILELHFSEGYLIFTFMKNETSKTFYLSSVRANLTYQFPQATETAFAADNSSLREFEAHLGHSYQCGNRSVALHPDFQLQTLQEHVQAFELKSGQFGAAEFCQTPRRSAIVPIIVGVVLGLLIVVVLVAYAVGRWRTHHGYQTI